MPSTSYSEASTYTLCRRRHLYGYVQNLERIDTSVSLSDGKIGHAILEAYYRAHQAFPGDESNAKLAALAVLQDSGYEWNPEGNRADIGRMLFDFYFPNEPFVNHGYKVLAVEKSFNLEYDEQGNTYPFVVDLILRDPQGNIVVVDHKFMYMFLDQDAADVQPQIPLYMGGIKALNLPADYGIYNMIRTQKIVGKKSALFPEGAGPTADQATKFLYVRPNADRIQNSFREQIGIAAEINYRKTLSIEEQQQTAWRVANKMVCQSCSFKEICFGELSGSNTDLIRRTSYKQRDRRQFLELSVDAN